MESDSGEEGAAPLEPAPISGHPEVDGHLALDADRCEAEVAARPVKLKISEETEEVEEAGVTGLKLEGLPAEAAAYIKQLQSKLAESQEVRKKSLQPVLFLGQMYYCGHSWIF